MEMENFHNYKQQVDLAAEPHLSTSSKAPACLLWREIPL